MTKALRQPGGLDITKPSPARIYDYMLRGPHPYDAYAEAAGRLVRAPPQLTDSDGSTPWGPARCGVGARGPRGCVAWPPAPADARPPGAGAASRPVSAPAPAQLHFRGKAERGRFFAGLEVQPPYRGAEAALTYSG